MKLITVATNFNPAEAEMVRARLEAAVFHPFVANENFAGWLGGTSTATMSQRGWKLASYEVAGNLSVMFYSS